MQGDRDKGMYNSHIMAKKTCVLFAVEAKPILSSSTRKIYCLQAKFLRQKEGNYYYNKTRLSLSLRREERGGRKRPRNEEKNAGSCA